LKDSSPYRNKFSLLICSENIWFLKHKKFNLSTTADFLPSKKNPHFKDKSRGEGERQIKKLKNDQSQMPDTKNDLIYR
jgi:hypothetical protein